MNSLRSFAFGLCLAVCLLATTMSRAASAQTRVRVVKDQSVIWATGFSIALTVVRTGVELDTVARRGNWYEVVLPPGMEKSGTTGLIAVNAVEVISGPALTDPAASAAARGRAAPPVKRPEEIRVRAFGMAGGAWFTAHQSFDAVFGSPRGLFLGGGGEVRKGHLYFLASIQRFQRTGERVFAFDGNTFRLGIADKVTMTPISGTVGWRLSGRRAIPYVGGGVGSYKYTETSDKSVAADDINSRFISYHGVAGIEWVTHTWFAPALELQYTHVPGALTGGVADLFGEHNLGGIEVRGKLLVGK